MFKKLFGASRDGSGAAHKEGDLYKVINLFGRTFEIRYGYYEEQDRYSKYGEPDEIYPDFIKHPVFTDDGIPFVTMMQDACEHYESAIHSTDRDCSTCRHFRHCEELIGICSCRERAKFPTPTSDIH